MQILVVEDEVGLARHISRALTLASHELTLVHDGETALGEAEANHYDLIVLDVMLPEMDGFEVLRRLRCAKMDTRVLILTARGEISETVRHAGTGCASECARATISRKSAD